MTNHARFYEAYAEGGTAPWDIGHPQPAIVEAGKRGRLGGPLLDVGCGTGEHALYFAAAGEDVVGVDVVPAAIELARAKAAERGVASPPEFVAADILREPESLGDRRFRSIVDVGFFHALDDAERAAWRTLLGRLLVSGGTYVFECFSDLMPGDIGPRRVTESEIRSTFAEEHGFRVASLERTVLESNRNGPGTRLPAWLALIERL